MVSIFDLFEQKDAYWYFYGAGEGEIGDLWRSYSRDEIDIITDRCPEEMIVLLKDDSEWGLNDSIPTRWLFEDFEEELIEGKKKYEEKQRAKQAENKTKRTIKKAEIEKLIIEARSKLSKKEWIALKKSL
jgi:hypothetical protein